MQRLLARFVDVIPKEYRNGVENGQVVIPLEYKEAQQFTQQAQSLVHELAPVWRRDQHEAYAQYHGDLIQKLAVLQKQIDQVQDLAVIEKDASEVASILSNRFGLSAHRAGSGGQIIEETAFDVRDALNNSHVSNQFSASQIVQGNPPSTAETAIEATYKVQIAPWWSVQPDVQYIITPSGVEGSKNAVVLGLRTNVAF